MLCNMIDRVMHVCLVTMLMMIASFRGHKRFCVIFFYLLMRLECSVMRLIGLWHVCVVSMFNDVSGGCFVQGIQAVFQEVESRIIRLYEGQ